MCEIAHPQPAALQDVTRSIAMFEELTVWSSPHESIRFPAKLKDGVACGR
jgi:hypothetical protein